MNKRTMTMLLAGIMAGAGLGIALGRHRTPEEKQVDKDQAELEKQGMKPTHSPAMYTTFANTIHSAIGPYTWNDEVKVMEVLSKMRNDLDVLNLIEAFGLREFETSWTTIGGELRDLPTAIQLEISSERRGQINDDYRWNGIKHRW